MGLVAALVLSVVALFTFAGFPLFQGIGRSAWSARAQEGAVYRPQRRSVMTDEDGYAYRTADNTQMTRRDRGREFWQANTPNAQSLRGWITETFHTRTAAPLQNSAVRTPGTAYHFTPRLGMHVQPLPPDNVRPTVQPQISQPQAPPPVSETSAPLPMPKAPVLPTSIAPLYQYQAEEVPHGPMGVGRKIQSAIRSDATLSEAAKLTIRVSLTDGKVVLRGLVADEKAREYVGSVAQKIAGTAVPVDNRLVVLNP